MKIAFQSITIINWDRNWEFLKRQLYSRVSFCSFALLTFAASASGQPPEIILDSLVQFHPIILNDSGTSDTSDGVIALHSVAGNENPWDVQYDTQPIERDILKGEVIEFSFDGCSLESASIDNSSLLTVYFAQCDPWAVIDANESSLQVRLDREWRNIHCIARADRDLPAGSVIMTAHCGSQKQTIKIRNPKLLFWGNVPDKVLPANKMSYHGTDASAAWRIEAENRIRSNRMSPVTVEVRNAAGEPVVGAKVIIKQRSHSYSFGTFTDAMPLKVGPDAERYRKTMRHYFNRVTLPRYFADWGTDSATGKVTADNMAAWAATEGYQLKTHLLLYPYYLPERVVQLRGNPEAFKREIELAMDDALARTVDLPMHAWDAINELRTSTIVADVLGESYYASVFNRGHSSQPNAKWFINDFNIIEYSPNQSANIEAYEAIIKKILNDGGKLSGIGFQGHFSEVVTPIPNVLEILDRFAKFGVPLEITEFDIKTRDEEGQAEYTRDLLTAFFSHPATTGFTCWGFWEGSMWRPSGAMIRNDWTTKPNGDVWNSLIKKQWWTDESATTDVEGKVVVPAFHGRHHIEVETDDDFLSKDILVEPSPKTVSVSLPNS